MSPDFESFVKFGLVIKAKVSNCGSYQGIDGYFTFKYRCDRKELICPDLQELICWDLQELICCLVECLHYHSVANLAIRDSIKLIRIS